MPRNQPENHPSDTIEIYEDPEEDQMFDQLDDQFELKNVKKAGRVLREKKERPKKVLSAEHKAKMLEGARRAREERKARIEAENLQYLPRKGYPDEEYEDDYEDDDEYYEDEEPDPHWDGKSIASTVPTYYGSEAGISEDPRRGYRPTPKRELPKVAKGKGRGRSERIVEEDDGYEPREEAKKRTTKVPRVKKPTEKDIKIAELSHKIDLLMRTTGKLKATRKPKPVRNTIIQVAPTAPVQASNEAVKNAEKLIDFFAKK